MKHFRILSIERRLFVSLPVFLHFKLNFENLSAFSPAQADQLGSATSPFDI